MTKEELIAYIKDAIIQGKLKPGQRIVEAHLCREFDAGRSLVRQALMNLEQEDFIQAIPYSSPVVTELSQKDIVQIYDLLGVLEGLSIRIATPRLIDEEIEKIESLVKAMEENQENKFRVFEYNLQFHHFLTELGGNTRLIHFVRNLRSQANRMSLQSFYNPEQIRESLSEHRKILNAIKDKKPLKAEKFVRDHYFTSKNRLTRHINSTL